jgi:predicted pyridoxine 5'-phosphate oxidase superfamily flavin-nucleotide-binding protein
MAKMSKEIMDFVTKTKPAYVGTASKDGMPNIAPKGSLTVIDDETLLYADLFAGKTRCNLEENNKVTVAFVDPQTMRGFQLKGKAQVLTTGKIYEETCKKIASLPMKLPKPESVVVIKVQEIYHLSPGPEAGKSVR